MKASDEQGAQGSSLESPSASCSIFKVRTHNPQLTGPLLLNGRNVCCTLGRGWDQKLKVSLGPQVL